MAAQISIVVPVYQVEPYLEKCVESLLKQTYSDIEVILVNDSAPDRCGEICDRFARNDNRVKVIHKEHGGLSAARNAGMEIASGEYIGFVDSDDWVEPDMYEYLLQGIRTTNSDIVCCALWEERLRSSKRIGKRAGRLFTAHEAIRSLLTDGGIQFTVVWNKLYRRSLWDNVLFPQDRLSEDTATVYRILAKARRMYVMPEAKYHYRINPNGLMRTTNLSREMDFWEATKARYANLLPMYPEFKELLKIDIMQAIMNVWSMMWEYGEDERELRAAMLHEMATYAKENRRVVLPLCCFGITGKMRICLTPYNCAWSFFLCSVLKRISDLKQGGG